MGGRPGRPRVMGWLLFEGGPGCGGGSPRRWSARQRLLGLRPGSGGHRPPRASRPSPINAYGSV